MRVVITDLPSTDNNVERELLAPLNAEVVRFQCRTAAEVAEAARDADALLVCWAPVPGDVIESLGRCRIISLYTAGYNNVDLEAAARRGITVTNNPDYCVEEVATHALALLLAINRKLLPLVDSVRAGHWDPVGVLRPAPALSRQTVGILGFGRIGRKLASLVRPLAGGVQAHDPAPPDGVEGVRFVSREKLFAEADYVSVHMPLSDATKGSIGSGLLRRMKPSAWLINTSRGAVIDEDALLEALRSGTPAGAALDVFVTEPLPPDHPFRSMPNVLITPHAAWYSEQSEYLLKANAARAVVNYFAGKPVRSLNSVAPSD
jgi:D-3-phosphoglycerate dehydrogenase